MLYEFAIITARLEQDDSEQDERPPMQLLAGGLTVHGRDNPAWELVSAQLTTEPGVSSYSQPRTTYTVVSFWRRPLE
jgi:hypothetical protein